MLDDQFKKQRASLVRDLAARADPFIRRRLLDLAARYEHSERRPSPLTPITLPIAEQGDGAAER
ncbi:hypothetical protein UP10_03990 [Bradyrhizobium sp. LTSPM299]|jgi:hypothetical protein|nr:hypothetical protein UP10_03990 [Bradyrhizobium sp. LTSPM299]